MNRQDLRDATAAFIRTARRDGHRVITRRQNPNIGVWLKDDEAENGVISVPGSTRYAGGWRDVPALAIYQDELENWVLINSLGKVVQYLSTEVV